MVLCQMPIASKSNEEAIKVSPLVLQVHAFQVVDQGLREHPDHHRDNFVQEVPKLCRNYMVDGQLPMLGKLTQATNHKYAITAAVGSGQQIKGNPSHRMGNNQPLMEGKTENLEHPRLGNIKIIKKEDNKSFIEYTVPVRNEQEIEQWQKMKQTISNSQTKQVLFLPLSQQFERSGMCGSSGNLKLLFEDYLFLLDSEIQNRSDINRPFMENEMWYLLYNIVRAGKEYEKYDRKIGDVQPSNIVINEDGQTKIISMDSWPGQEDNFEKVAASRQNKAFLAPEECVEQFLRKGGEYPPGLNRNIAQAFSIGLTLLEAASLKNCWDIYEKGGNFSINQDTLRRIIESARANNYSSYLINTIESLIAIDPKARPSCGQIHAVFYPYEAEIMNLEDFAFDPSSSEKCLATFQKCNPKYKSPLWNFKKILAGSTFTATNDYRPSYQNPSIPQVYQGGQAVQSHPVYGNVGGVGAPQIVYSNPVPGQYPQYRR